MGEKNISAKEQEKVKILLHNIILNSPAQAESLLHNLEWAAGGIDLLVDTDKTECMCFNQKGNISTL